LNTVLTSKGAAAAVAAAADVLRSGGVVVVPTDTVYGVAARPDIPEAVEALYRAKGRPSSLQLPVLAASIEQVVGLGVDVTPAARALAARWWPGPLTMAFGFESGAARPQWLSGRDEVAVRIPDHDVLQAVLSETGVLVVTSANSHGAPTPHSAAEAAEQLGPFVDLVVDGGPLTEVPSTLVNVSRADPVVEREGAISRGDIANVLKSSS
jgi:L-threonylcarbamoyladenylate synthase